MFGLNDNKDNGSNKVVGNISPMPSQLDSTLVAGSEDTSTTSSTPLTLPASVASSPSPNPYPSPAPAMPAEEEIKDPSVLEAINDATSQLSASSSDSSDSSESDFKLDDIPDAPMVQTASPPSEDLLKLKHEALSNLAPLIDHLDQTPEERFKTTMMLIQASDNSNLIPDAYKAASKIEDEKTRAQALLDVVNEINYFTQAAAAETKSE